jgi:hypothetical protein
MPHRFVAGIAVYESGCPSGHDIFIADGDGERSDWAIAIDAGQR